MTLRTIPAQEVRICDFCGSQCNSYHGFLTGDLRYVTVTDSSGHSEIIYKKSQYDICSSCITTVAKNNICRKLPSE